MDCQLTPEICGLINQTVNSLFYKIGLGWFIALILLGVFLYFTIKQLVKHNFEQYKSDIEKSRIKNIELWKQQKELMFDFVKLLEEKFFNNPEIKDPQTGKVKSEIFAELNKYYGQLYLVMETEILETINNYLQGTVSPVQRFYIYKELRKQLMSIIHDKFTDDDCPFIGGNSAATLYFDKNGVEKITTNFEEVQAAYPFVEKTDDGKYKTLPNFNNSQDINN